MKTVANRTSEIIEVLPLQSIGDMCLLRKIHIASRGDVLLSVPEELPSTSNHEIVGSCYRTSNGAFGRSGVRIYLLLPQPRKKWQDAQPNLKEDDIVLIKEEGPPGTWPMARSSSSASSNDGLVRVATVKTQDSVFKRPVHKLSQTSCYIRLVRYRVEYVSHTLNRN
ncbi:hypothetical protein TNCV_2643591 [Trichonephila clavipes]|nr:hypothetical protein TNCV_2643591 [Trichonephila clavipes]